MMMLHSKTLGRPATASPKLVATRSTAAVARKVSARLQAEETVAPSATAPLLTKLEAESSKGQVYGKPLSKSEVSALKAAIAHLEQGSRAGISTAEGLRTQLMSFLKEAATTKTIPLNIVEGSMVLLEQLYLMDARPKGPLKGVMTRQETLCRWQLVIGADVGSIQYIPVVEEFEVFPDGTSFALDTDLGWLFTGFSGDASWFSPGHARYHVRRVRLELRLPKALQFWKKDSDFPPEKDDGKGTCRPDKTKPAVTIPLPFPENELFIFASNGDIAPMRSKLGGLILLVNKTPVEERSKLV